MAESNSKSRDDKPRVKYLGGYDIFIIVVALVVILMNFKNNIQVTKKLTGLSGWILRTSVERKLGKVEGVKSAEVSFNEGEGGTTACVLINPWTGQYPERDEKTVSKIYSIIMDGTNLPANRIVLFDGSDGKKISIPKQLNPTPYTDYEVVEQLRKFEKGKDDRSKSE